MSADAKSALEVGRELLALVQEGRNIDAIDALYANDVESVEAAAMPDQPRTLNGHDAVRGKSEWWEANHDVHEANVRGPYPHDDRFIMFFDFEVTAKGGPMAGQRYRMEEGALYTVKDGKIVKEEFFYHMG